jgi:hypothetical protein
MKAAADTESNSATRVLQAASGALNLAGAVTDGVAARASSEGDSHTAYTLGVVSGALWAFGALMQGMSARENRGTETAVSGASDPEANVAGQAEQAQENGREQGMSVRANPGNEAAVSGAADPAANVSEQAEQALKRER